MATKLEKPLKREIDVGGTPYMLTITPEGFTLVVKGKRKGVGMQWTAFLSGDAALASALNASLSGEQPEKDDEGLVQPAKDN